MLDARPDRRPKLPANWCAQLRNSSLADEDQTRPLAPIAPEQTPDTAHRPTRRPLLIAGVVGIGRCRHRIPCSEAPQRHQPTRRFHIARRSHNDDGNRAIVIEQHAGPSSYDCRLERRWSRDRGRTTDLYQ